MSRKKTLEEYIKECKEKGYDLPIEDYKGAKIKIKHKCSRGHVYEQAPHNHLHGKGCSICSGKKKKTPQDYLRECKEKGYDLPIEDYINNYTKINHKCLKGHIYLQAPNDHLRGKGCPTCKKKTTEKYLQECKDRGYDLPIEGYVNSYTKINHRCKQGHIYLQAPNNHLKGFGCPTCSDDNKKKTTKEYIQECKEKGYDLPIEDYKGSKLKIKHMCSHGHTYSQTPGSHLQGKGCPKCSGNYSYTFKEYYDICKDKGLDLPVEDYIDAKTKIKHKCSKGHTFLQSPDQHLRGCGCSICSESHGEKYIRKYLNEYNIKYESQKKFHDLKDKTYLSYDFYLPDYNILIEYQGIQHYESVSFNGRDYSNLEKQQYHDNLKRKYAKENGYRLLRPTYKTNTQEKINRYLDRYLVKNH